MLEETDYVHNMHKETFRQQICITLTDPNQRKTTKRLKAKV